MLLGNADMLDAAVCLLAAQDFLSAPVIQPVSPQDARKGPAPAAPNFK